jgi:hypothetical protein
VDLIKVDMVQAETGEAAIDARKDVAARKPDLIRARPHAAAHLRGDHELFARAIEGLQRLPHEPLAVALRVHVGRVDEVDASVQRR